MVEQLICNQPVGGSSPLGGSTKETMFRDPHNLPKWFNKKTEIKESPGMGLGVFATEKIEKHEIFERAPVLIFSADVFKVLRQTEEFSGRNHVLNSYAFSWEPGECCVVWGNGSLYNHGNGSLANCSYRMQTKIPCVEYYAKRDIEPGEEILIHYLRGKCDIDFCEDGTWLEADRSVGATPLTSLDSDWKEL